MSHWFEHISPGRPRRRLLRDRLQTLAISAGGAGVLITVLALFIYLSWEVLPLFRSVTVTPEAPQQLQLEEAEPLLFVPPENGQPAWIVDRAGWLQAVDRDSGRLRPLHFLGHSVALSAARRGGLVAVGFADGYAVVFRAEELVGLVDPRNEDALEGGSKEAPVNAHATAAEAGPATSPAAGLENQAPLELLADTKLGAQAVEAIAISRYRGVVTLVGELANGGLQARRLRRSEFGQAWRLESVRMPDQLVTADSVTVHVGGEGRWLYLLAADGGYTLLDLASAEGEAETVDQGHLFASASGLADSVMLFGGFTLVAASKHGQLTSYLVVRDEHGQTRLQQVREFDSRQLQTEKLLAERSRRGFFALDRKGALQIYYSTSSRPHYQGTLNLAARPDEVLTLSTGDNQLYSLQRDGYLAQWRVDNPHPEVSWSALWNRVWYESYDRPARIWQSSAVNAEFEPKYSFAPLTFGTLKAAFYTMLLAAPLAVCGAIYTAYFMAPALRRKVKPVIELMEALPTVILGFLAGLWLAPLLEEHMAGLLALFLVLPPAVALFALLLSRLPLNRRLVEGWTPILLMPLVMLVVYLCFAGNDALQTAFFGGDFRLWIQREFGLPFDQRNALVIGIAMGLAVIPSVFSIAEDALFSVPGHLGDGALALGATRWQALYSVVLPTASPGVFSALMIGMGRAIGETMIVLMATGNTPIMDANLFEGMRTLAANIAVETPEAELGSTHYRLLILTAFVLFMLTFAFNTAAELVRQRLRSRYGAL